MVSETVVCLPISDLGPNDGDVYSFDNTHFGAVAQDPHDGSDTHIALDFAGATNVCGVDWSPVPLASKILSITVRWAVFDDVDGQEQAGLSLNGALALAPSRLVPFGVDAGIPAEFRIFDEIFDLNPWTNKAWKRNEFNASMAVAHRYFSGGTARLTELVAIVTFERNPPVGEAESLGTKASATGSGPEASSESSGSSASAVADAASASAAANPDSAEAIRTGPSAAASGKSASGHSTVIGCTAIARSLAPRGECASLAPEASARWLVPEIGDAE